MATFDYKKNDSWGNTGWLSSNEYYAFWGRMFAQDLAVFFKDKIIIDVGAGNGNIWQEAFNLNLSVKELHLIDPALNLLPELSENSKVIAHKTTIGELKNIHSDVVVFKQSIHHVYESMGLDLFNLFSAKLFINFSMPLNPDWPISPQLKRKFTPSYLDVKNIVKKADKKIVDSFLISYPVKMKREKWCLMLKQRFTSILHNCDDSFINNEVKWVKSNLPEKLSFYDHLECLIFE